MIQQSMKILIIFILLIIHNQKSSSSCIPCSSNLCSKCYNTFPNDRINLEKLSIQCNTTNSLFKQEERFYSIIESYTIINCTMKTLYLDQYTLWNYLESMSITYANLTRLSPMIFNRSLSSSPPVLYSIKTLNLSYNSLRSLIRNFSYYFPSLEKLDLSHNQLISIRKTTFKNLIYLKELYLNNNNLQQIFTNMFPSQSLYLINLNVNPWNCTCTNVLTLSISRPIPICSIPNQLNASDIARQCFLRTKTNILITTNIYRNLTCVLSSIIDSWRNKIIENMTFISAWHIEQRRTISFEQLSSLNNQSNKYLICFNFNSTYPEIIHTIIRLPSINLTVPIKPTTKLPRLFLWILKISKNVLPKSIRNSDKHVLIVWLILLAIVSLIFIYLIYWIYQNQNNNQSRSFIRFDRNLSDHRTLFNVKLTCKNHKCLCQYRRRAHSTLYLTKSISSNLQEKQSLYIQPSLIEPNQLRYAKIKRISSTNDYLTGEFRTIVKFKSLPN